MSAPQTRSVTLPDEDATARFAAAIAPLLRAGDTLLLSGEIGAGKSAFARALIRARLGWEEDVPSPTFTLVQTYDDADLTIWHCDLYRLTDPQEVFELGLDEALETAVCLIEWPDRLGQQAPPGALQLKFTAGDPAHHLTLSMPGNWAERLDV
ncbi:tRNA (adenosine(37)-N6)-threonylcarbamoyltransferase complex ATPase subunit type 1 TsaE [Yoonia sp. R2331]|uniref:tRNA (adenosine(37)-N6)-threonylcarbamoyltransferase complex ATPase subunit type 1 TsaE n=1 Tax=Yoonia sp. R2331 TaxID=3237238 RepID=UPI0034E5E037